MNKNKIDMTGRTFGNWKVIRYDGKKKKRSYWWCKCSCGLEKSVDGMELRRGNSTSCGHDKKVDLTGKTFNEWTVLKSSRIVKEGSERIHFWLCQCSCGKIREVTHGNLANNSSTNCGHINETIPEISLGDKFNDWEIVGESIRKNRSKYFLCRCSCGIEKYIEYKSLFNGTSTHCGHKRTDGIEIGMRFGRLVVIDVAHKNKDGTTSYLCNCDCGNTKISSATCLKFGNISSCGCYRRETSGERISKYLAEHKDSKTFGYKWYFYGDDNVKISCRSSFEVLYWNYYYFVKKEKIIYEPKVFIFENNSRYTPDFYFPEKDAWIETKGSFKASRGGEVQEKKIKQLKKEIDLCVLFWKDIYKECELKYKSITSYFNNAKKANIPIEDYLANMMYL